MLPCPQALQGPAGPSAHLAPAPVASPACSQSGRDSVNNILKLVIKPECHRNMLMRPGILPVSKTPRKYTTLNFQIFHILQPSLARNKWSCFRVTRQFIVKTAKCRQKVCTRSRSRSSIQDPVYSIQYPGFSIQYPGFSIQYPGFSIQGSGSRVQAAGSRVQAARALLQGSNEEPRAVLVAGVL